jgi:hypothetical protein
MRNPVNCYRAWSPPVRVRLEPAVISVATTLLAGLIPLFVIVTEYTYRIWSNVRQPLVKVGGVDEAVSAV